jgi:hypothetical protein
LYQALFNVIKEPAHNPACAPDVINTFLVSGDWETVSDEISGEIVSFWALKKNGSRKRNVKPCFFMPIIIAVILLTGKITLPRTEKMPQVKILH